MLDRNYASSNRDELSVTTTTVSGDMDADARGGASETIEEGSKVLIIGAGCSGLALAHGLKKVYTRVTVKPTMICCPQVSKASDEALTMNTGWNSLRRI